MKKLTAYCRGAAGLKGAAHPRWKDGGRWIDRMGYVCCKFDGTQIYEQRLVMERHLGRKLSKQETVHHKNGIRTDNRLENLELWSSRHPRGARVEDLVNWANEILAKYSPLPPYTFEDEIRWIA